MRIRALVCAFVALLVLVQAASAATGLRISSTDVTQYPEARLSVVTPTPSAKAPTLRENGQPVVGFKAENLARAKSVLLAIDRSRSMQGKAFVEAVAAARAFIASKPPADRVGIVAFGSQAVRLTGFSSATIDADGALGSLAVDTKQGTALYDAVLLGSRALGAESLPGRVLIVLTDGDDVSSKATLGKAAAAARRAGVSVYAIGIESADFSPAPLKELARVSGGSYFGAASNDALGAAYASIAEQLRRTWRLSYLTAASPGERVRLDASLPGVSSARAEVRMPGSGSGYVVSPSDPTLTVPSFFYEHNVGTVLLALFTGSCAILAIGLMLATPNGTRLRRRLEPHVTQAKRRRTKTGPKERFAAASGVMLATERSLGKMRFWASMHKMLDRADLPLRTVEFFYICAGAGVLLSVIAAVAAMSSIVILFAMALGFFGPVLYVSFKAKRRMLAIDDQLPDLLITIAASLKAGHSFRQGLQAVVDEGMPPASSEFKRVLTETSLGRPMDDALAEMSERVGSKNLDFVITAVTIQRQVGGSLAGIFDMVADAVRQRQQFARKIRSLTAMGRMSAYTLVALPFLIAAAITALNREYMDPLYNTSAGHKIIVVGLVMMAFGSLILKKIISFKG